MKTPSTVFTHLLYKIIRQTPISLSTVQTLEEETKVGDSSITTSLVNVFSRTV